MGNKQYDSYYNPITGGQVYFKDEIWKHIFSSSDPAYSKSYNFHRLFGSGVGIERTDVGEAIQYYLTYGEMPSKDTLEQLAGRTIFNKDGDERYYNIEQDVKLFLEKNKIDDAQLKQVTAKNREIRDQGYNVVYSDNGFTYTRNNGKAVDLDTINKEISESKAPSSSGDFNRDYNNIYLPDGSVTDLESLGAYKDDDNFF